MTTKVKMALALIDSMETQELVALDQFMQGNTEIELEDTGMQFLEILEQISRVKDQNKIFDHMMERI